jgi:RNA polymerase sigma-70 factor (ECF subfamily)
VRDATLDRLVVEHLPAALAFATRLCGSADRAEDLVQESLVRVLRAWPSFRGEAAFRTWFFRIVINVFRDSLRGPPGKEISAAEVGTEHCDAPAADPVAAASVAELREQVALEVSRLPTRQREVLVLCIYEGLTTREVAAVLGISETNVHSTLSLARARLRERLAKYLGNVEK